MFLNNVDFVKKVVIVTILILILAGLFWWFLGPHTNERLEKVLFYGGGLVIIIGLFIRFRSKEGTYSTIGLAPLGDPLEVMVFG